jgi:hypothetical protein
LTTVADVFRFPDTPPPPPPRNDHVCDFWTLRGVTGRELTCSAYGVETGLELRAQYGPHDIAATELFRGVDADARLAEKADAWRLTLMQKGFRPDNHHVRLPRSAQCPVFSVGSRVAD